MGTATKSFGSSKREGHDSSAYYGRKILDGLRTKANGGSAADMPIGSPDPKKLGIYCKSSERMREELPENSVALVVTSPPYNVGKEYDADLSLDDYLGLLKRVFGIAKEVLEPGGRVCINIANIGRKPYIPLTSHVNRMMVEELGYLMRGEILWVKGDGANGSCAWGSWRSAKNPVLRDTHEYILVFSKGQLDRAKPGQSSISADEFLNDSLSVWTVWNIEPESASRVGHPAPFPEELPSRLIKFYTYENDLVLDPFCGVGTTCVAAKKLHRGYIGYDIKQEYVDRANRRLEETTFDPIEFQRRAAVEGKGAERLAESILEECGFRITARDFKLRGLGIQVNFVAEDRKGRPWYFDVSGAFTSNRAGLKRTDTVYKCLGRASIMALKGHQRLVFLTTDLPKKGSSGDLALRATRGHTFFDVIEMENEAQKSRLREYSKGDYDRPIEGFWRPGEYQGPNLT